MSIAKNASASFYHDIVYVPSLFDYLVDIADSSTWRRSFMLVRWPVSLISFFQQLDYSSVSKPVIMEKLTACYATPLESCIIAIRPSSEGSHHADFRVVAYSFHPGTSPTDLPSIGYWDTIPLADCDFSAYVFLDRRQAAAYADAHQLTTQHDELVPLLDSSRPGSVAGDDFQLDDV